MVRGYGSVAVGVLLMLVVSFGWAAGRAGRVFRTPQPPADARLGDVWVSPKDGAEMVYVPAGKFTMGSTNADIAAVLKVAPSAKAEQFAGEKPQFSAYLSGYWIDKREVTIGQYRKFLRETTGTEGQWPGWSDDSPVVYVSWYDAVDYAKWAGKRLPTEMEWEKAARGTDGRKYPWGNEWDADKCANWSNSSQGILRVGSHPADASPFGVLDLAGSLAEWCADWYEEDAYKRYAKGDLAPASGGENKVVRGSCWFMGSPSDFRCAGRGRGRPGASFYNSVGFRCVRGPG